MERLSAAASYRAGNIEAASRFLNQAFQDGGTVRAAPAWQSRMLESLGRRDRSEAVLRAAAERQQTAIQPWADLIRSLAHHGKATEVAATIEQARSLIKPEERDLAEAQFRWAAGDRKAADLAFRNAIARKPGDVGLLMTAARYFKEEGQLDEAATQLKAIMKVEPENREAVQELAVLLATRPETWSEAERLIGAEPSPDDLPTDRLARGMVMARATDPTRKTQAVKILENLVEDLSARSSLAIAGRTYLIRLLLASGQPDRAREVAAILATASETPEALGLYIECLIRTKKIPERSARSPAWNRATRATRTPRIIGSDASAKQRGPPRPPRLWRRPSAIKPPDPNPNGSPAPPSSRSPRQIRTPSIEQKASGRSSPDFAPAPRG